MHPTISIFNLNIPSYYLCALLGAGVCSLLLIYRHRNFKELCQVDITNSIALAVIGMIIGAKALFAVTVIPVGIHNAKLIKNDWHIAYELISAGVVFYGGLFGALIVMMYYCKKYSLNNKLYFDYVVPVFPLFHAFGRVGCFLTGCCHGKESVNYGIIFTESESGPNGVPLFPIQLVSTALELVLFTVLMTYEKKNHGRGKVLYLYLLLYSLGRFIIEFFRGDTIRGIWLGLSTSQWIAILVIIYVLVLKRGKPLFTFGKKRDSVI